MEMKKSISDTERALRSYGAVSETAWTTDKGEPHASKHHPGGTHGRFLQLCVTLRPRGKGKPGAFVQEALKWLIGDSQSFGTLSIAPLFRGLLIPPHAHCGAVCTDGEWICARGRLMKAPKRLKNATISLNRGINRQYLIILIDLVVQFFHFTGI